MSQKLQVIYVTGLGDKNPTAQQRAVKAWRRFGVRPLVYAPHWADGEAFQPKLQRLVALIDRQAKQGEVCLVGASAGASLVINAFAERREQVRAIVCICGKFNYPETVSPRTLAHNPAFGESMAALDASWSKLSAADKQRIVSIRPLYDESVPVAETAQPGIRLKRVWLAGHAVTIAIMISVRARTLMRCLRRTAR